MFHIYQRRQNIQASLTVVPSHVYYKYKTCIQQELWKLVVVFWMFRFWRFVLLTWSEGKILKNVLVFVQNILLDALYYSNTWSKYYMKRKTDFLPIYTCKECSTAHSTYIYIQNVQCAQSICIMKNRETAHWKQYLHIEKPTVYIRPSIAVKFWFYMNFFHAGYVIIFAKIET